VVVVTTQGLCWGEGEGEECGVGSVVGLGGAALGVIDE